MKANLEEGADIQTKGTDSIVNEIRVENFLNLGNYMDIQEQKAFRTPNRYDEKRTSPCTIRSFKTRE
jgi:hypothetical protein